MSHRESADSVDYSLFIVHSSSLHMTNLMRVNLSASGGSGVDSPCRELAVAWWLCSKLASGFFAAMGFCLMLYFQSIFCNDQQHPASYAWQRGQMEVL